MFLHEINDLELPNFICANQRVMVKFTAENCPICERLAPAFQKLSGKEEYSGIKFLKMDAKENPLASRQVQLTGGTPFIATYQNGSLKTCKLVSEEADLVIMLDALL